jgi:hypothetical protein
VVACLLAIILTIVASCLAPRLAFAIYSVGALI